MILYSVPVVGSQAVRSQLVSNNMMDYGKEVSTLISRLTDSSRYDKQIRPNFGGTPVMVNITILVNDISQLSEINMVSWEKRSLEICPNGD